MRRHWIAARLFYFFWLLAWRKLAPIERIRSYSFTIWTEIETLGASLEGANVTIRLLLGFNFVASVGATLIWADPIAVVLL